MTTIECRERICGVLVKRHSTARRLKQLQSLGETNILVQPVDVNWGIKHNGGSERSV
jgi:hypothetical protein